MGCKWGTGYLKLGETELASAGELREAISRIRPGEEAEFTLVSGGETKTVSLELAAIPDIIPEKLTPDQHPAPKADEDVEKNVAEDEEKKTGRITQTLAGHEHDLWAFVPEDYSPEKEYGLLVWLHPAGDTMEAAMLKAWKPICRERGIILLAPKAEQVAGWTPGESGFVKAAVESFLAKYSIDPQRVVLHSFATGAGLAQLIVGKERELFSGISLVAAPLMVVPPENRPEYRLQWNLISGEKDRVYPKVQQSQEALRKLRFPVTLRSMPNVGQSYPAENYLEELGRWIDSLDRI